MAQLRTRAKPPPLSPSPSKRKTLPDPTNAVAVTKSPSKKPKTAQSNGKAQKSEVKELTSTEPEAPVAGPSGSTTATTGGGEGTASSAGLGDLRGRLYKPASPQRSFRIVAPPPTRDPKTREFHFADCEAAETNGFRPNVSPEEMLRLGSFGGCYFRQIRSKRLGKMFADDWKELPSSWIAGLDVKNSLTRSEPDPSVNKWKVQVGQSIEEWEANGWIVHEADVRGWFQWYCRFFMGRRCDDDERQIMRWKGVCSPTGRWRVIFLNKYVKTGILEISPDTELLTPGIRQTLLHWAFSPTTVHLTQHAKKMAGKIVPGSAPMPAAKSGGKGKGKGVRKRRARGDKGWESDSAGEKEWDTEEEGVPEGEEEKVDDRGPKEPEKDD